MFRRAGFLIALSLAFALLSRATTTTAQPPAASSTTSAGDSATRAKDLRLTPWGVSSSASAFGNHQEWFPKVAEAGVAWVRLFPEWRSIEPKPSEFKWEATDLLVQSAAENGIEINGILMGSTPWKTGKLHAFPMNDLASWSNFVEKTVGRYKGRIRYWEVWNEGNGGFNDDHHTTEDYARLVAATYKAAKQADPNAQIGLTVASYDPAYLRQTILALKRIGAANSFDYLCIHPYELADGLVDRDGEIAFLSMAPAIRTMLKAEAPEHADAEIWITEVGRKLDPRKAHGATEKDAAEAFAKIYLMALAQGIKRIQWFEAQDPPGEEAGFGLLKRDGSPRAAYTALKTLHEHLGASPEYLGWAALGEDRRGFGFVFRGAKGPVLAAWSPQGEIGSRKMPPDCGFAFDATTGEELARPHNVFWSFAAAPQLLPNPPADLVAEAQANKSQPFPWGGDFSQAASVVFQAGASGFVEPSQGVMQTNQRSTPLITFPDGSSGLYVRANQGTTFSVHPTFADFDDSEFYVRVTVRRLEATNIGMNVFFAAADGQGRSPYKNVGTWFGLNSSDDWQTHTWRVQGASLCKLWGFDFSLRPEQSAPFAIGKVEVSKTPFAN